MTKPMTSDLQLLMKFPEFAQHVTDEFFEYLMYGMFMAHVATDKTALRSSDVDGLCNAVKRLSEEHEAGFDAFREGFMMVMKGT